GAEATSPVPVAGHRRWPTDGRPISRHKCCRPVPSAGRRGKVRFPNGRRCHSPRKTAAKPATWRTGSFRMLARPKRRGTLATSSPLVRQLVTGPFLSFCFFPLTKQDTFPAFIVCRPTKNATVGAKRSEERRVGRE